MKLPISSSKTPFYCLLSAVLEFHNLMENKDLTSRTVLPSDSLCNAVSRFVVRPFRQALLLRKVRCSLFTRVISVYVCPHGTTRLPLDGF